MSDSEGPLPVEHTSDSDITVSGEASQPTRTLSLFSTHTALHTQSLSRVIIMVLRPTASTAMDPPARDTSSPLPPFTSVRVALRTVTGAQVAALSHVALTISDFLDYGLPQFWSLPRACEVNLLSLLPRLVAHGVSDGVDPYYWKYQCGQGLVFAVKHNNLQMVEWLHVCCPSVLPYNAMIEAARAGNVQLLEWLSERHERAPWLPHMMDAAASTGQIEMLEWLCSHSKNAGCTNAAVSSAVRGGHLETVTWLHDHYTERFDTDPTLVANEAILYRHNEIAKFLYTHFQLDLSKGLNYAAEKGDLEIVQWLYRHANGGTMSYAEEYYKPIDNAALSGSLQKVQWLHEHFPLECSELAMDNAAYKGYLDIVQWLHENRNENCAVDAMDLAASSGHLHIVQWLHTNRSEGCSTKAMDGAAKHGHLEVVKWLHENRSEGCTIGAMFGAAVGGHLDVVKWLHANRTEGCMRSTMNSAAMDGHLEVVKWLHANRYEGCSTGAMDNATMKGQLKTVKWLHNNRAEGCTSDAMNLAALNGHLDVVKWLHENRTEGCTTRAMRFAAMRGHFEVLLFLHENRSEGFLHGAIYSGVEYLSHLEILQWVLANYPDAVNIDALRGRGGYMAQVLEHVLP